LKTTVKQAGSSVAFLACLFLHISWHWQLANKHKRNHRAPSTHEISVTNIWHPFRPMVSRLASPTNYVFFYCPLDTTRCFWPLTREKEVGLDGVWRRRVCRLLGVRLSE
jgi:hypothetical protein